MAISDEFIEDYDDATDEVMYANSATVRQNIGYWIRLIEENPTAKRVIEDLTSKVDFDGWFEKIQSQRTGMGKSGLEWPDDRREKVALQYLLYRHFSKDENALWNFGIEQMQTAETNINALTDMVNQQIFGPLQKSLRKIFQREGRAVVGSQIDKQSAEESRVLIVNQNSPSYIQISEKMSRLIHDIRESNSAFQNEPEEKERALAEGQASQALLSASRVRLSSLKYVVVPFLIWLADVFAGGVIGGLASDLYEEIKLFFDLSL